MLLDPASLPDTFWRVSAKALIFDADGRLLVFMDNNHEWEIPGGGWEHAETFEECLSRELAEEIKAKVVKVGKIELCYKGETKAGYPKICVAARVGLASINFTVGSDDLIEARFVTQEEFLQIPFQKGEAPIKAHANQIWP